jgi:hypothetical protein
LGLSFDTWIWETHLDSSSVPLCLCLYPIVITDCLLLSKSCSIICILYPSAHIFPFLQH